jgi:NDP-sugar pyrophosphorylase family protein
VKINEEGKVLRFDEKQEGSGPGWINAGVYLLKTTILDMIPARKAFSLEQEFFPILIEREVYGYLCNGAFIDIGTSATYAGAERFFCPENG